MKRNLMREKIRNILLTSISIMVIGAGFGVNEIQNKNITHNEELNYTRILTDDIIMEETFSWFDVTSHGAKFKFSYISVPEEDFDPANDLVLIWDKDNDNKIKYSETYGIIHDDIPSGGHSFKSSPSTSSEGINFIEEEKIVGDGITTVVYEVKGLKPNQKYEGFSLYLRTSDSAWVNDGWNDPQSSSEEIVGIRADDHYFSLEGIGDHAVFITSNDPTIFYLVISFLLIIILLGLLAFMGVRWLVWWNKHMRLAIYLDGKASYEEGELILSLLHVNKNEALWNAHESDLVLIAAGRPIDAMFRRVNEIENGYRIYITENTVAKRVVLSLISASRYNKFSIGIKGGEETFHATSLSEQRAQRVVKAISKSDKERYEETREMILHEIAKKYEKTKDTVATEGKGHNIISAISDKKSRPNSIRYQVLFPSKDPKLETFDPTSDDINFYHVYQGKLYKMKHRFIAQYGSMFEYDLIDLNPESIYVGLSTTIYCDENNILPSASLYGITRDEQGALPNKTEAQLGKPHPQAETRELWNMIDALENLGKEQFYRMFEVITKKHYEDENHDSYLPTMRAREYHDDYIFKWLRDTHREIDIRKIEEEYGLHDFDEESNKHDLTN